MDQEDLQTAASDAEVLIEEEVDRTRATGPDPAGKQSNGLTDDDVAILRENFPILNGFSVEFIKSFFLSFKIFLLPLK